jgi:hypothetical protein
VIGVRYRGCRRGEKLSAVLEKFIVVFYAVVIDGDGTLVLKFS